MTKYPDYRSFAIAAHNSQTYGHLPYAFHLSQVEYVLCEYGYTSDDDRAIAWCHDLEEDCEHHIVELFRRTFNKFVVDMVHGCSGYGANRKERVACINDNMIRDPRIAPYKAADRIVNGEKSKLESKSHFEMYKKEYSTFRQAVCEHIPTEMLKRLDEIFDYVVDSSTKKT